MLRRRNVWLVVSLVAALFAIRAVAGTFFTQNAVPKTQDKLALGEDEVKKLLLLIDTGKTGKITRQKWMKFIEAEFDRLDKNKSRELDARELAQSRLRVSPFANVGK